MVITEICHMNRRTTYQAYSLLATEKKCPNVTVVNYKCVTVDTETVVTFSVIDKTYIRRGEIHSPCKESDTEKVVTEIIKSKTR